MKENNASNIDKPEVEQVRLLRINTNSDKTEAYITIEYTIDSNGNRPPMYKLDEIRTELNKLGIIHGIIEENLLKCSSETKITNLLIAKGNLAINDEDDKLEIKYQIDNDLKQLQEDSRGKIDFKNIGAVNAVLKGDLIAVRIPGKEGTPGRNVFGETIEPRPGKKVKLNAGQGCQKLDDNKIASTIDGKPCLKNNTFHVYNQHEVQKDVDLSTGNITFLGDIKINGSIKEGMKVVSGNSIYIGQNVECAVVQAKNDIIINGNVISSTILGGGEDNDKIKEIEQLTLLNKLLNEMIVAIEEIKKFNLLGYDTTDGQIVKLLIDSKFKTLPMACMGILALAVKAKQQSNNRFDELSSLVKKKLIALGPLSIKHYSEIIQIMEVVKKILEENKAHKYIPVNVKLNYCQDSRVISTGNIIFSGKGAYVSSITSQDSIHFIQEKSVVRGGTVKADNEISCKVVGSPGGVVTKLMVSDSGHIRISVAYENTILYIGSKETVLDYACKDLHAYIDSKGELVVDRLRL